MYKIYHGISPTIMNEILTLRHRNQYNLRNWTYFDAPKNRTVNMVLRALDISVLRFGKSYQHIQKSWIPLTNLKLLLKNGNQNLVHVGCAEQHKFVALFAHIL